MGAAQPEIDSRALPFVCMGSGNKRALSTLLARILMSVRAQQKKKIILLVLTYVILNTHFTPHFIEKRMPESRFCKADFWLHISGMWPNRRSKNVLLQDV